MHAEWCEWCGSGSPWGDRARRALAYLVDGAALVLLAVVAYLAAGYAVGVSP